MSSKLPGNTAQLVGSNRADFLHQLHLADFSRTYHKPRGKREIHIAMYDGGATRETRRGGANLGVKRGETVAQL